MQVEDWLLKNKKKWPTPIHPKHFWGVRYCLMIIVQMVNCVMRKRDWEKGLARRGRPETGPNIANWGQTRQTRPTPRQETRDTPQTAFHPNVCKLLQPNRCKCKCGRDKWSKWSTEQKNLQASFLWTLPATPKQDALESPETASQACSLHMCLWRRLSPTKDSGAMMMIDFDFASSSL